MSAERALAAGLQALALPLTELAQERLLAYMQLVEKWNRVYNLTAVRESERMVPQHLLDALAVAPHLRGRTLLDVGSGAGLPGIPLAIMDPELDVTLLDSTAKKLRFLNHVVRAPLRHMAGQTII